MANILPPFPPFSVHEDDASVGPRWKKWLKRFEMYLAAHEVKDPTRKRALLLYSAGEEVADIFETLPDQGEEKEYDKAVTALNAYFQPKVNKTYEIYMFRNATQNPGELLDSYCTRLRRLAQTCEFASEDEEIKSHIVVSCSSSRLRRRALREDMNLKDLLAYGRGLEMSDKQAKGIEEHEKLAKVSPVQTEKRTSENKKCYRCGEHYPHKGRPCPALKETCKHCHKKGHFATVCRSRLTAKKVNTVGEGDSDESTDEEYTYRITLHSVHDKAQPLTEVIIGEKTVKCLIDSGAGVNVIDTYTFNQMENIHISPTLKKIYGYRSSEPLPVVGTFEANIKSGVTNKFKVAQFCVVDGQDGNLIGYETAIDLGLLRIVNSVSAPQVDDIVGEYKDCFEGLGKMKDKAAKLHVNSSARPLAQKFRRLPFHVREQVEAELKNLEELDIIERAEGPTPWVSPIVVVPKKTGIRICVDMRAANQAIERERHPVPTVEDLIVDLNGSTVFSKIDLNQGYHQLELEENSRGITFATHFGFTHRRITPMWPRANGEAERLMRTLEKAIRTAVIEGKSWRQELFTFLRQYRATPHSTTGKSPSELLNGRKLKSTLPQIQHDLAPQEVRQTDAKRKTEMKEYADRCSHAKNTDLSVGDKVLLKQPKQNKMSTPFKPEPLEIKDKKGSMITAQNAERTVTRNASFFKKLPSSVPVQLTPSDEEEKFTPSIETAEAADVAEGYHEADEAVEDEPEAPPALRRLERTRRVPEHFKDYVT